MRKKTKNVSIEIYDAEGELCESIGGPKDYEDIREQMIEIMKNDGIPVLRQHGKHEKVEPGKAPIHDYMPVQRVQPQPPKATIIPDGEIKPLPQPLVLNWEFEGVKFYACGMYDDVMDAQAEFLDKILEEET